MDGTIEDIERARQELTRLKNEPLAKFKINWFYEFDKILHRVFDEAEKLAKQKDGK